MGCFLTCARRLAYWKHSLASHGRASNFNEGKTISWSAHQIFSVVLAVASREEPSYTRLFLAACHSMMESYDAQTRGAI